MAQDIGAYIEVDGIPVLFAPVSAWIFETSECVDIYRGLLQKFNITWRTFTLYKRWLHSDGQWRVQSVCGAVRP